MEREMKKIIGILLFFSFVLVRPVFAGSSEVGAPDCGIELTISCHQKFGAAIKDVGTTLTLKQASEKLQVAIGRCRATKKQCSKICPLPKNKKTCLTNINSEITEASEIIKKMIKGTITQEEVMDTYGAWNAKCPEGQAAGPGNKCYTDDTVITIPEPPKTPPAK
jgi:hypothetical protein